MKAKPDVEQGCSNEEVTLVLLPSTSTFELLVRHGTFAFPPWRLPLELPPRSVDTADTDLTAAPFDAIADITGF